MRRVINYLFGRSRGGNDGTSSAAASSNSGSAVAAACLERAPYNAESQNHAARAIRDFFVSRGFRAGDHYEQTGLEYLVTTPDNSTMIILRSQICGEAEEVYWDWFGVLKRDLGDMTGDDAVILSPEEADDLLEKIKHIVKSNDFVKIQQLLEDGEEEQARDLLHLGSSPSREFLYDGLKMAAGTGDIQFLKFLIAQGASVRGVDGVGGVLHFAALSNKVEVMQVLFENGIDVNQRNEEGACAIHHAATGGKCEKALTFLLEHGAEINAKDAEGKTAAHLAAIRLNEEMIEILINHGADLDGVREEVVRADKEFLRRRAMAQSGRDFDSADKQERRAEIDGKHAKTCEKILAMLDKAVASRKPLSAVAASSSAAAAPSSIALPQQN